MTTETLGTALELGPVLNIKLRSDAVLCETPGTVGGLQLSSAHGTTMLPPMPAGVREALRALGRAEATEAELAALVTEVDGEHGLLRLHLTLRQFDRAGLLEHAIREDGVTLARLRPVGRGPITITRPAPGTVAKLSRFAVLRAVDGVLGAREPRSHLALDLAGPGVLAAGLLAGWTDLDSLVVPGISAHAVKELISLFAAAGLLVTGGPGDDPEEQDPARAMWSPEDLWVHAHARGTRLSSGYGGSYRFKEDLPPLPAVPREHGGARIVLPRPDLEAIEAKDPSFTRVLESRRSVRTHDNAAPITAAQLGELLFRALRHRRPPQQGGDGQQFCDRPYPSAGGSGELEVYPLVTACEGIEPGLWHYESDGHALRKVAEPGPGTAALLGVARSAGLMNTDPQVVLIVAARFGRVGWKYESIAYSLILKDVGVLYQTIYLVAAAMGLAVCGLGGGDAADFAAASGIDYFREGSVGEILLGSLPAGA
jgi:SagB-type dehydrogenase family enzyme